MVAAGFIEVPDSLITTAPGAAGVLTVWRYSIAVVHPDKVCL